MQTPHPSKRAFSLVELSIVLVILGLLVGGILAGRSLIRASELRAVSGEYQRYMTAAHAFRDKYFALPGDFSGASQFWQRMSSSSHCVTNSSATINSDGACDGNSDGQITAGTQFSAASELAQFWRHLNKAGLLEGTYSGISGPGGSNHCVIGTNCPASKLNGGGWGVRFIGVSAGSASSYALSYGNAFYYGGQISDNLPTTAIMSPEEAWNIDTKIDDGLPAYGKVIARYWNDACSTANTGPSTFSNFDASYRLSDTTLQCAFFFRNIF